MSFMFKIKWGNQAPHITIELIDEPAYCHEIDTEEIVDKPWFHEVKRYLEAQEYPEGAPINDKKFLRIFSAKFILSNGILYKCNHDSTLLRYIDKSEADKIMADLHKGTFGTHSSGHTMAKKSYGQGTTGLPWKQIAICIYEPVTSVRSMLTKYMCL